MRVVEEWPEYVRRLTSGQTLAQIAQRSGISMSNIGRWIRGELVATPDAANVIAFAKAYGQNPMEALAAAGYFTASDVQPGQKTPLTQYSTDELMAELRRRTRD